MQDWFHESCLNLRERPSSREPTPEAPEPQTTDPEPNLVDETDETASSSASSSGLPPPLLTASDYDTLICASCVSRIPTVARYAGTPGALMVTRANSESPWKVHQVPSPDEDDLAGGSPAASDPGGPKRPRSPTSAGAPEAKRLRVGEESSEVLCRAPLADLTAQRVKSDPSLGTGDVFLTDGWRERWCRCLSVRIPCVT
jgi:E3 ubiquitin-protein ligase UBR7